MTVPTGRLLASGILSENVPLGPLTTYKTGGPARYMAEPRDRAELDVLMSSGLTRDMPVLVLGRGSNLLVADAGFPGLVIRLGEGFATTEIRERQVTAGAAVALPRLARSVVDSGLGGLEFFVGVPGSVGGAVRQNAGCFGRETKDVLIEAEVVDLLTTASAALDPRDLELSYRHSNLESTALVVMARFEIGTGDVRAAKEQIREITRWRRDHQPGGTFNAGSVFKNPEGLPAGELIDRLGLKGLRVGEVAVSEKHANFFVAGPGARAQDILTLVELVKDRVFQESGTILEPEIQFVGFDR